MADYVRKKSREKGLFGEPTHLSRRTQIKKKVLRGNQQILKAHLNETGREWEIETPSLDVMVLFRGRHTIRVSTTITSPFSVYGNGASWDTNDLNTCWSVTSSHSNSVRGSLGAGSGVLWRV